MIPLILCVASLSIATAGAATPATSTPGTPTSATASTPLSRIAELGPVRVTTTLTPREPTIGDEIVLEIKVESAAGVDVLMPEFGEALSRYTIVDYVPRQHVADDGSTVHIQRYTLQPYLSGPQSIPPILIEFVDNRPGQRTAPDDLDAYEILTERLDFEVKSVLPSSASAELNPPLGKLALHASSSSTWRWAVAGTLGGLIALAALVLFWRSRRRRVQRRNAYEIARTRLDLLMTRSTAHDATGIDAFFVELSAIIRRYLEDRFDLRAPELTTEEFLGVAGSSGSLSRDHQGLLREFLRRADLVKFAGLQASEQDIHLSTDLAVQFLEETRENAPWIEIDSPRSDGTANAEPLEGVSTEASAPSASADDSRAERREEADV